MFQNVRKYIFFRELLEMSYNELKFLFKIYDNQPQNFIASGRIHLQINLQQSQLV